MKPNAYAYCELTYNSLKQNMHHWGDPDWTRPLTRTFYNFMFGAGTNPTGFISEAALNNKLNKQKLKLLHLKDGEHGLEFLLICEDTLT